MFPMIVRCAGSCQGKLWSENILWCAYFVYEVVSTCVTLHTGQYLGAVTSSHRNFSSLFQLAH